jgi:hypothetical protein
MIYLTNDEMDQAVYFDLRKTEPRRKSGGIEHLFYGLLGNGVSEVPVTVKSWRDCTEVSFGRGGLFSFVEENSIRRMLGAVARELALQ